MKNIINLQKQNFVGHRGIKKGGQLVKIGGSINRDDSNAYNVIPSGLVGFKSSSKPPLTTSLPKNPTSSVVEGTHQVNYGGALSRDLHKINFSNRKRGKKDENVKLTI